MHDRCHPGRRGESGGSASPASRKLFDISTLRAVLQNGAADPVEPWPAVSVYFPGSIFVYETVLNLFGPPRVTSGPDKG